MKENFTSGIDEGRQDKLGEACFLLYLDIFQARLGICNMCKDNYAFRQLAQIKEKVFRRNLKML